MESSKKVIRIEQNEDSPSIILDEKNLIFAISGPSYPEDAFYTYSKVISWLNNFNKDFSIKFICKFAFSILSSASHKMIYEILIKLENLYIQGKNIEVEWSYEKFDEDMKEIGEDYMETLDLPFVFVSN